MSIDSICCFHSSKNDGYRILWEITNRCNQNCMYCNSTSISELQINNLNQILCNLSKICVSDIILTGGEPLLHPNWRLILEHLSENNYSIDMCTNGELLDKYAISYLKDKLSEISISLDTVSAEHYQSIRGSKNLPQVLSNIKTAVYEGINVHLTAVVTKYTVDDLDSLLDFCIKTNVKSINFIKMMTLGVRKDVHDLYSGSDYINQFLSKIQEYRHLHSKLDINLKRFSGNDICQAGEKILGITSDGYLVPCIQLMTSGIPKSVSLLTSSFDSSLLTKIRNTKINCCYR